MIGIIDYGMGNLRSVAQALERVHARWLFVNDPATLSRCSKLILPGVGAFEDAIAALHRQSLVEPIVLALRQGTPFLGVCLGMQLLFDVGYENGEHPGLGYFAGKVLRFRFGQVARTDLKTPHMGWNRIFWDRPCPLFNGINRGAHVYFVHSYYCEPLDVDLVQCRSEHGYEFTSAVWRDNVYGVQFHPEKSQAIGLKMYENFNMLKY